eukprot:22973-Chlamydomonas_euryale.AAC.1
MGADDSVCDKSRGGCCRDAGGQRGLTAVDRGGHPHAQEEGQELFIGCDGSMQKVQAGAATATGPAWFDTCVYGTGGEGGSFENPLVRRPRATSRSAEQALRAPQWNRAAESARPCRAARGGGRSRGRPTAQCTQSCARPVPMRMLSGGAVSYTHLTLPTILLV